MPSTLLGVPSTLLGALAESEERYRSVIAAMSEGVVLQGKDSAILACNESAERLLGLTAEQMAGRNSHDPRWRAIRSDGSPFPGEDHPASRCQSTGLPQRDVEMGVHKPDGTITWISINAQPLFREGEHEPYAVVTTFSDVTARKRAERELRESEERYRHIVEASTEGIWTIDLEGHTVFANARMARMLRCPLEELEHSSIWDFVDPEDRPQVVQRLQARSQGVGEEHEFRFRAKDNTHVWASLSACAITLPDGRGAAMAMVRDITEQKQLIEQLQQARRLEAIGRLAGGVAHDFNNLLTAILSSVWLAERGPQGLPQHLETIRAAAERAATLTRQLLAFARKQKIELRPLLLSEVVRRLSGVLQRVVGEHIELELRLEPDTWSVLGDPSQLEQVLINLVANARDAMPGGGRVSIATKAVTLDATQAQLEPEVSSGGYVVLSVHDEGPGIDESMRQHIFEPFFTTKTHGTGLGLASCYGIAKQLGGHIRVRSDSAGTTFDVYLPRSLAEPSNGREPAATSPVSGGHETLLIVEDEPLVRDSLRRALVERGYTVLTAQDGEEALTQASAYTGPIALLITDVVMPKLGGRQLAERLEGARPGLKTLFVSGYLDQVALPERELGGPRHFLQKPYSLDTMARCVRELLDRA